MTKEIIENEVFAINAKIDDLESKQLQFPVSFSVEYADELKRLINKRNTLYEQLKGIESRKTAISYESSPIEINANEKDTCQEINLGKSPKYRIDILYKIGVIQFLLDKQKRIHGYTIPNQLAQNLIDLGMFTNKQKSTIQPLINQIDKETYQVKKFEDVDITLRQMRLFE